MMVDPGTGPQFGKSTLVDHLLDGEPWDSELAEAIEKRAKTPSRRIDDFDLVLPLSSNETTLTRQG
jgi:hypothetical protein